MTLSCRYYISAEDSSTERHLYVVDYDGTNKKKLTDISNTPGLIPPIVSLNKSRLIPDQKATTAGFYSASFSPKCGFYSLAYKGPGIPWSSIYKVNDPSMRRLLV